MTKIGIITPVKNEKDNLPELFESIRSQSLIPHSWAIVDDGSTDGSTELIRDFAKNKDWIFKLKNDGKDEYQMQSNYAKVLRCGFINLYERFRDTIDYYMILDGDMSLSKNYLRDVGSYLDSNPNTKVASGGIYVEKDDRLVLEKRSPIHPAGGATLYDGDFYRSIGGPPPVPGVDSATEVKARIRGFECAYLTDIESKAIQSRPTGGKGNKWENSKMRGSNNYRLGHRPSMMIAKSIWKARHPPFYPALAFFWGYLSDLIKGEERIRDEELLHYYQNQKPKEMLYNFITIKSGDRKQ